MRNIALLLAAICMSVTGELLLKYGMNQVGDLSLHPSNLMSSLIRAFTSPFVLLGFAFVFGGSIFWLSVISRVQLSYAYPMLSLGYVLVVISSWLFLNEQVSMMRLAGVLVICAGVFVVSRT
ncbi:MAG: EamA family transporter [Chloroflexi bacterium]|nr:EamA family transporter [Chloroflexota bacterium]